MNGIELKTTNVKMKVVRLIALELYYFSKF